MSSDRSPRRPDGTLYGNLPQAKTEETLLDPASPAHLPPPEVAEGAKTQLLVNNAQTTVLDESQLPAHYRRQYIWPARPDPPQQPQPTVIIQGHSWSRGWLLILPLIGVIVGLIIALSLQGRGSSKPMQPTTAPIFIIATHAPSPTTEPTLALPQITQAVPTAPAPTATLVPVPTAMPEPTDVPVAFTATIFDYPTDGPRKGCAPNEFKSAIWGKVVNAAGLGMAGVTVTVTSNDGKNSFAQKTNNRGGFDFGHGFGCTTWVVRVKGYKGIAVLVNGKYYSGAGITFQRNQ